MDALRGRECTGEGGLIEVGLILLQCLAEMTFVQDEEEVEALAPNTAQKSLANSDSFGWSIGRGQDSDIGPIGDSIERNAELVVVVTDQKTGGIAKWYCLPQLLGDPGIVWTSGHAEMQQAMRTQLDHNEDKDDAEEEGKCLEEVNGPHVPGMVAKECGPRLPMRQRFAYLVHVPLSGALGDLAAQLEQFPANAFCSPGAVVLCHGLDECHDIMGQRVTALLSLALRPESSDVSEEVAVPTQ